MRKSRSKLFLIILTLASFLFAVTGEHAAIVDTEVLSLSEFDQQFIHSLELYKKDMLISNTEDLAFSELENLRYGILDKLIEEMLFSSIAKKDRITVSEDEIRQRLITMEKSFPSRKYFMEELKSQNIRLSQLRKSVRTLLIREKVLSRAYPDLYSVTTHDLWIHLKTNSISPLPFSYNVTLLATDNRSVLETLRTSFPITGKRGLPPGLNEEISSLSLLVKDEDLKPEISAVLVQHPFHEFSSPQPLGDRDFFVVRLNEIQGVLPPQFQEIVLSLRRAIFEEKMARHASHWIEDQRRRQKITVNQRVFPRYYNRD